MVTQPDEADLHGSAKYAQDNIDSSQTIEQPGEKMSNVQTLLAPSMMMVERNGNKVLHFKRDSKTNNSPRQN